MPPPAAALSPRAFLMLLALAWMFGGNHVAARLAFNDGVDVATAVTLPEASCSIFSTWLFGRTSRSARKSLL